MKGFIDTFKKYSNKYHLCYLVCYILFLDKVVALAPITDQKEVIATTIAYMLYIAIEASITYLTMCIIYYILDMKFDK